MSEHSKAELQTVVDRIHTRMLARYGSAWVNLYAAATIEDVKRDWARCLWQLPGRCIGWALGNLPPDRPPNAAQFRALCLQAPDSVRVDPAQKRLEAPLPAPDLRRLAGELQRLAEIRKGIKPTNCLETLEARRAAGERLTAGQLAFLREARSSRPLSTVSYGEFRPIDADALPPAMRETLPDWARR